MNICENHLQVEGPTGDLWAFTDAAGSRGSRLSFQQLLPAPDLSGITGDQAQDWRLLFWNTRSEALDAEHEAVSATRAWWYFDTEWYPPVALVKAVAHRWPGLVFTLSYAEPRADFAGRCSYRGTSVLGDLAGSYAYLCGDEESRCRAYPLSDAVGSLPEAPESRAARSLLGSRVGPGGLKQIVSLDNYELSRRYLESVDLDVASLVHVAERAVLRGYPTNTLTALCDDSRCEVASVGVLYRALGTFLTLERDLAEAALREALARSCSTAWAETVALLSDGWAGSVEDLLEAATHLLR